MVTLGKAFNKTVLAAVSRPGTQDAYSHRAFYRD